MQCSAMAPDDGTGIHIAWHPLAAKTPTISRYYGYRTMTERVQANNVEGVPTLSERMRNASKEHHDRSDTMVNFKLALILTSKPLYAEAISLFWPIYAELERILETHKTHPQLGCLHVHLPTLRRSHLFEKDMTAMLGGDEAATNELKTRRIGVEKGRDTFSPPELQNYIDHLRTLSEEDPLLLLPYIYSMYSAILAGGSIIRHMVTRAFSLKTEAGVEMFHMSLEGSSFANIAEFRTEFRRTIDQDMTISDVDQARIVQEAPEVFIRNNALVATAQDSEAFGRVWHKCQRFLFLWGIPAISAVFLAGWMYSGGHN
jgi:heme oxygenase